MKERLYKLLLLLFRTFLPVTKRKIIFLSYYGEQYGCNPKYLSEYLIKNNEIGWKVVWVINDRRTIYGAKSVRFLSIGFFYHISTAKVIVSNYRMTELFVKRKKQIYVQTWHSSLRLKMIEKDTESTLPRHYVEMAKHDSSQIDILLSGCEASSDIFRRCFWYDGQILESGTPRCDLLVNKPLKLSHDVRNALGISQNEFVVLYAPTFRKDNSLNCYDVDFVSVRDTIQSKTRRNVKILLRLHPHLKDYSSQLMSMTDINMTDVTRYDDIQELLMIADCLITDYSGLMFDFMLTDRPCYLYTPDLEKYIADDRKLYFKIEELPFPLCRNNKSLLSEIEASINSDFSIKYASFYSKVGSCEDGNASKRVVEYLNEKINEQ